MSERKVLNKYYPPDFDPSKIPRGKRSRNATFNIRIMAPFNMRCNTCKEYIYKGKKFNSRKEDVVDEFYLGLRIFRFYIKCPRCVSEIAFKTDIENTDYTLEAGATRLFEAEKLARQMEEQERKQIEEDELNPMKVLENRTKASIQEMDQIDSLEELREINSRKNVVNTEEMIEKYRKYEELLQQLQMEEEEKEIREIFGSEGTKIVKRLHDSDDEDEPSTKKVVPSLDKPTDILAQDSKAEVKTNKKPEVWQRSIGSLSSKRTLSGLVVKKKSNLPPPSVLNKNSNQKLNSNTETEDSLQEKELAARNTTAENISTTLRCSSSDSDSTSKKSTNQNSCSANDITEEKNSSSQGKEDIQKAEKETLITEKKQDETVSNKIMVKQGETISDKITVTSSTNAKSQVGSTVTAVNGEIISKGIQGSDGLGLLGAYSDSEGNESD